MFAQLVCEGCRKILTYPHGALSCRCRNCSTVNASQNLVIHCPHCTQDLITPINTLTLLCPCCATVIDIPESMLPHLEDPIDVAGGPLGDSRTMYVSFPARPMAEADKAKRKKMERRRRRREQWERANMQRRVLKQPLLPPLSSSSSSDDGDDEDDEDEEEGHESEGGHVLGDASQQAHDDQNGVDGTRPLPRLGEREETESHDPQWVEEQKASVLGTDEARSTKQVASQATPSMASARYPRTVVIATRIL